MFVAALLLLIVVVLLVLAAVLGGSDPVSMDFSIFTVNGTAGAMFFLGGGTLLLLVLSLALFRTAARRASARRADRKRVSRLSEELDQYKREERESTDPVGADPAVDDDRR